MTAYMRERGATAITPLEPLGIKRWSQHDLSLPEEQKKNKIR